MNVETGRIMQGAFPPRVVCRQCASGNFAVLVVSLLSLLTMDYKLQYAAKLVPT